MHTLSNHPYGIYTLMAFLQFVATLVIAGALVSIAVSLRKNNKEVK
jgi:hypothetical protein